jgi:hypothetical protein
VVVKTEHMNETQNASAYTLKYVTIKTAVSPEDQNSNRKRYVAVAQADELFGLNCSLNVRSYLGLDADGSKRKATLVNLAIRDTIENRRDLFPILNSGVVIVARNIVVDDGARTAKLSGASIINGAQTMGVLQDYFHDHPDDDEFPSVNVEIIVTDDEELIGDVSIARNFQNRVTDLSIYGRMGRFDKLEAAMQEAEPNLKLRKRETDFGDDFLDTEKLIQVLTVLTPKDNTLPSVEKNRKTPETMLRVYAYRHRSRCLKDFAEVMDDQKKWSDAFRLFLDLAPSAWKLYQRLRGEQAFSILRCVKGETSTRGKTVTPDGVPDGIVFPMLSALSRFVRVVKGTWRIDVPKNFPWNTLFEQARIQETTTASNNPQTMGKDADCYIALHGAIDMYFAVMNQSD